MWNIADSTCLMTAVYPANYHRHAGVDHDAGDTQFEFVESDEQELEDMPLKVILCATYMCMLTINDFISADSTEKKHNSDK